MPIPPTGWGAVEILIWNYAEELRSLGHIVHIINCQKSHIVQSVRDINPDFVHIQYDDYADLATECSQIATAVAITSHFGYLEQAEKWHSYHDVFTRCINHRPNNIYHLALSPGIAQVYKRHGVQKVFVTANGADAKSFTYSDTALYPDRTLCLGKIEARKGQHLLQHNPNVWFAGNKCGPEFDYSNPRYLGEWTKDVLYANLTNYANLVLLSDGEADPLVVKEALVAGLGVVVSECAAANLDTSQPFISVVTASQWGNVQLIDSIIDENRKMSIKCRADIRIYSKRFWWSFLVPKYSELVCKLVNKLPQTPSETTIVTCYFKIASKRNHAWYAPKVANFVAHVNQECYFWTTEDVVEEFKSVANPNVNFVVVPGIPECPGFDDVFWERQVARDPEKYHTVDLAKVWYLKRWFVLETCKRHKWDELHKFIWCDAGCVRSQTATNALWMFGSREGLRDHKMHLQTLPLSVHEVAQDYFVFPTVFISAAIMFGSQEAWFVFNALYNDILNKYDIATCPATSDQYIAFTCVKKVPSAFVLHTPEVSTDDAWFQFLETA
jgi:hypothetical protein